MSGRMVAATENVQHSKAVSKIAKDASADASSRGLTMRPPATTGTLLVLLALLLAPLAGATGPTAPTDLDAGAAAPGPAAKPLADAGAALASGANAAASGLGGAATAAGQGLAHAAAALGAGLVATAMFLGSLLAGGAALLGNGLAALGRGLLAAATFLFHLVLDGARVAHAHPVPTAVAAGSATALAGLAWLLKRLGALGLLVPLYTRLAPSRMLDNKVRAAVYDHVRAHPGAHPSAIAEALDLGWGTIVYHLAKLEETRLVTSRSAHNRKCYFAITADLDGDARTAIAAMGTDKTRSIVETVRATPGISQKELSEKLGMSQALASWHVKRLVQSGVLVTEKSGRSNALRVAPHVPGAAALAA